MFFLAPTEAYLIFKLINKSESGYLSLDEFYGKLMHVVLEIFATEEAFCLFFFGKLNNIFSEFFCPSFIQKSQFKFAQLLIYISKVNQSAAVAEVVSKEVKLKMRHKYRDSPKPNVAYWHSQFSLILSQSNDLPLEYHLKKFKVYIFNHKYDEKIYPYK